VNLCHREYLVPLQHDARTITRNGDAVLVYEDLATQPLAVKELLTDTSKIAVKKNSGRMLDSIV
jgi:hypothetical protein